MDAKAQWKRMITLRYLMRKWMQGNKNGENPFRAAKLEYGIKGRSHDQVYYNFGEFMDKIFDFEVLR